MAALFAAGVLPSDEVDVFTQHVSTCDRCATELAELRQVTQSLHEVPVNEAAQGPPEALRQGVVVAVGQARRSHHRARRLVLSVATAAAAIALIGVGAAIPGPAGPPQEAITVTAASPRIDADASLVAHTWGTELKLVVSGLDAGTRYQVSFLNREGRRVAAGTFIGVSDRPVVCDMNAAVLRPDAARLEIASRDGVVLHAELDPP
jgi:anti-sigma factor RsiW